MMLSDIYCPSCRNAKDHKSQDNEVCWSCAAMGGLGNYKQRSKKAERIRSMSDEELAEFILPITECGRCPTGEIPCTGDSCRRTLLDWLREEVNE